MNVDPMRAALLRYAVEMMRERMAAQERERAAWAQLAMYDNDAAEERYETALERLMESRRRRLERASS